MRRPRSVTIPALLLLLYGLLLLIITALIAVVFTVAETTPGMSDELRLFFEDLSQRQLIFGAVQLALGAPMVAAGYGMLRLRPWSWLLAMVVVGCNSALLLVEYFSGAAPHLEMLISAGLTLWINQREVQRAFRVVQHHEDPAGLLTVADDAAAAREAHAQLSRQG